MTTGKGQHRTGYYTFWRFDKAEVDLTNYNIHNGQLPSLSRAQLLAVNCTPVQFLHSYYPQYELPKTYDKFKLLLRALNCFCLAYPVRRRKTAKELLLPPELDKLRLLDLQRPTDHMLPIHGIYGSSNWHALLTGRSLNRVAEAWDGKHGESLAASRRSLYRPRHVRSVAQRAIERACEADGLYPYQLPYPLPYQLHGHAAYAAEYQREYEFAQKTRAVAIYYLRKCGNIQKAEQAIGLSYDSLRYILAMQGQDLEQIYADAGVSFKRVLRVQENRNLLVSCLRDQTEWECMKREHSEEMRRENVRDAMRRARARSGSHA